MSRKQPGADYLLPHVSSALLVVGAGTGEARAASHFPVLLLPTPTSGKMFLPMLCHTMWANHTRAFCSARRGRGRSGSLLRCGTVTSRGEISTSPPMGQVYLIMRMLCVLHPLAFVLVITLSVSDLFIFRQSSAPLLPRLGTWGKPQTCP